MDQLKLIKNQSQELSEIYETLKSKIISFESGLNVLKAMLNLIEEPQNKKSINKEFFSYQELSEFIGIPVTSLQTMVCKKEIPYYKQNGVKFKKSEILEWMSQSKIDTVDNLMAKY